MNGEIKNSQWKEWEGNDDDGVEMFVLNMRLKLMDIIIITMEWYCKSTLDIGQRAHQNGRRYTWLNIHNDFRFTHFQYFV